MGQLLAFLFKFRAFFTFLVLEVLCISLIISNNNYQKTVYINTASGLIGTINESSNDVRDYFSLRSVNRELAEENQRLRSLLLNQQTIPDSLMLFEIDADTTDTLEYVLRTAEVIDNSTQLTNNLFMIDKGSNDGIKPNMGIITSRGIVGKVRSVSPRYARAVSLLNTRNPISAKHKKSNRLGTVQWDGINPQKAKLLYVMRDVQVAVGDTILTSGFNTIFPKNLQIGIVSAVKPDPNQRDLDIQIELAVDFGALEHVYVIENRFKPEKDSLEQNDPLNF